MAYSPGPGGTDLRHPHRRRRRLHPHARRTIADPNVSPDQLTAISLAVVFFNALSGSESYAMMKRIDYKSGLMFAAATIPGAIIGALNTSLVPRHVFNGIFAVLLIAAAIFLSWRPQVTPRSGLHIHRPYAWR